MRPFWVPMEAETEIKKYSKINNVFILVKRQDLLAGLYPTSYRIAWPLLLFRNSTTVSLFLCGVRTAQPYVMLSQTQLLSLNTVVDSPLGQGRDEVRWRPGQSKSGAPHVRNWGLSEADVLHWRSTCNIAWTFRRPRSDSAPPWWLGARGIVLPLPPRCAPALGCTKLVCFLQVYFFNAW